MVDLVITPRASILIVSHVTPTAMAIDHHAVECVLLVVKPVRPKCRVRYRNYGRSLMIYRARSPFSRSPFSRVDTYNIATANIVDKYAPIIT